MSVNKILNAKAKILLQEYQDVIEYAVADVLNDLDSMKTDEDTAFKYAKSAIRRQATKEALIMFQRKLNIYSNGGQ